MSGMSPVHRSCYFGSDWVFSVSWAEKMPVMVLEVGESPGRLQGVGAPNGAELEGVGDVEWVEMRLIWPWHRVEVVGREVAASRGGWGCFGCSIS